MIDSEMERFLGLSLMISQEILPDREKGQSCWKWRSKTFG